MALARKENLKYDDMSIIGNRVLFKTNKQKESIWGTVLDKIQCKYKTKYLIRGIVKKVSDEDITPEITKLFLVSPKKIESID